MCRDEQLFSSYYEEIWRNIPSGVEESSGVEEGTEVGDCSGVEQPVQEEANVRVGTPNVTNSYKRQKFSQVVDKDQEGRNVRADQSEMLFDLGDGTLHDDISSDEEDEQESYAQWKWFLEILQQDLDLSTNAPRYVFMSDQQKGLDNAIAEIFPQNVGKMDITEEAAKMTQRR
ncbi:hypothetical protein AAHA92_00164 [Salvia divinorum]|uniref:Uncharacterized protein n=1 Tax=Salvia divinorum TaxID=28513 RepID=A0ABD1IIM2_SALDI